ncbi:glycine-rich protein [Striga hermonthica]|uniref:Glycine-rich protein n=1 Tax=Striga hermonthica TaxID=68872 RepID=A0A9N7NN85_STRHE|nr:glycine-rich protein [Striga hermonthica]
MSVSESLAPSSSETAATDGPALNLINKRLRALRKKLNRIAQMEESLSQGKTLNKEQEETLRSKSSVLAGIDELEKLRQPLLLAVEQEVELALGKIKQKPDAVADEIPSEAASAVEMEPKSGIAIAAADDSAVSDLLNLLYFGTVFDVKTLFCGRDNMLTRTHERNCCLTYDCVTDDDAAGDLLKEPDLDSIASLGSLLVSRPVNSSLSHKNALQKCLEHAKLWLANAEQPIDPNTNITYAGLREKLNKIMASEYFTTTPEIKDAGEVAAAGGNYASFQVPVQGTSTVPPVDSTIPVEGSTVEYQQEKRSKFLQEEEQPNSHEADDTYVYETGHVQEYNQDIPAQTEQGSPDSEHDRNSRDVDLKDQNATRKSYHGYRSGSRGGGGGRRGYSNGRGGRGGGRGGFPNGRGQFYDQPGGGYYQRSNYGYRGRSGRGTSGGGSYNHHGPAPAGQAQVAS